MTDPYGQSAYDVRFDWGPVGAAAQEADVTVVVDVLSFSTSVCIAVQRGMRVYPFRWRDERAAEFAREQGAVLAVGRLEATKGPAGPMPSLSPAGLLTSTPVERLVLPSPNGSTIVARLSGRRTTVALGCLRNATAVAAWLVSRVARGDSIGIVAAGERWAEDDSLRPALEDQLGAGAILAGLARAGQRDRMSPEARAAAGLFDAARTRLAERLHACVGGRELTQKGFASDVDAAAALDASTVVPVLADGAFGPAAPA